MRLRGERGAARARALVGSFRPLRLARGEAPRVVLTGFGAFAGAPRNATEEMIRTLASDLGVELRARSFRARELAIGRGVVRLPSSAEAHVSLMVLPVVWEAAAALVAKEARASRASLVVMSGIASKMRTITLEGFATSARRRVPDVFGVRPARARSASRALETTLDVAAARAAVEAALSRERVDAVEGVTTRELDATNAYVCNDIAHLTARLAASGVRVLRSTASPHGVHVPRIGRVAHGFVHWPAELAPDHAPACARVLLSMVDALIATRAGGAA
jgi:pyrrolidone-carboxylate peptidase